MTASPWLRMLVRPGRLSATSPVIGRMTRRALSTRAQNTESFLTGSSGLYAEQMYDQYCEDPESVHPSWKQYFDNLEGGIEFHQDDYSRPSTVPGRRAAAATAVRNDQATMPYSRDDTNPL